MKKTINVNLNGRVFTIDEDAYQLLDNYLRNLRIYFRKEEGAAEIIADFEARIEELFSEKIRLGYQVINISQVEEVIARVGKPDDFSKENGKEEEKEKQANQPEYKATKKKFFRNPEDKIIGGICSGVSAYFGWDVLPVRIVFIIMIFATSLWIIPAYLLVWMICPEAWTAEQKLQMRGKPINVENIGKTVSEEIERPKRYENNGREVNGFFAFIGNFLKACFIGFGCLIGIPLCFVIIIAMIVLFSILFGVGGGILACLPFALSGEAALLTVSHPVMATITFIVLLLIPFFAIIYGIIAYFAKPKPLHNGIKWTIFLVWIFALILFLCSGFRINKEYVHNTRFHIWSWPWDTVVEGNGIPAEREYFISPIDNVSVDDNLIAHLVIEQVPGDSASLLLNGDENLIDKIYYKINEGKLRLFICDNCRFRSDNGLVIRIQTPSLRKIETGMAGNISLNKAFVGDVLELELDGVGKFQADSLTVQVLKIDLDGSCSVKLAGYARKATFDLDGAGSIDAGDLLSDSVYAEVEGVASIRCNPTEYLKGRVTGVGSIKYKNEPKERKTEVLGIGSIRKE